ncbi:hypothetical protein WJX72_007701 [[Myrmecia] bisecta]|uniref:Fungal lipase-type domain-containing protein n=1 Tax=[Myrmecia] bisecta TaxID=41462 RepID=A0AAW1QAV3_9CHLO
MRRPDPALADPEAELGVVSDLSSPVLCKVAEAFVFSRRAQLNPALNGTVAPSSEVLIGKDEAVVHIVWNPVGSVLVLAFRGPMVCAKFFEHMSDLTTRRAVPSFCANIAADVGTVEVQADFLEVFESFIRPTELGQESLTYAIRRITRGRPPRRIITTGFCMGGSLATLGAVWAALQSPTADVRCISFGAPKIGNSAFAQVFRWLVALSYRLVFHKDPVPDKGSLINWLVPVHGAIYMSKTDIVMGERSFFTRGDMKDHCIHRYTAALKEAMHNSSNMEAICEKAAASGSCKVVCAASDWQVPGSADSKHSVQEKNRCIIEEAPPATKAPVQADSNTADAGPKNPQQAEMQFPPESILSKGAQLSKGIGTEEEAPGWLRKAFSLLEREDLDVDLKHLDTLQRVLVIGKISQAVVVAGAAYADEKGYIKRTGILNSRLLESKVDTQVHVGWLEGGTAVFAFRGTQSAQDGLQDAKFIRKNINYLQELYPGTKAHTGFLQQFASVVDPDDPEHNIAAVLKTLSGGREPNRVLCTGHSLGGALATLGAAWAAIEYPRADVRCITFGSPRVGNNKFKHAFHKLVGTSLRLVHGADPVPSMPPSFRYHHVKGAIHVRKSNLYLRSRPWHVKYRPNVADHLLVRYNLTVHSVLPGGDQADLPSTGASPADRERQSAAAEDAAETRGCFPSLLRRTVNADSDPDSPTSPRNSAFEDDAEETSPGTSPKHSDGAHEDGVNGKLQGSVHQRSNVDKDHHGAGLFKRSLARISLGLVKA